MEANKQNDVWHLWDTHPGQQSSPHHKKMSEFYKQRLLHGGNNRGDDWINQKLNQIFGTTKYSQMIHYCPRALYRGRGTVSADTRHRRNIAYAIPTGDGKFIQREILVLAK